MQFDLFLDDEESVVTIEAPPETPKKEGWNDPVVLADDAVGGQIASEITRLLEKNYQYFDGWNDAFRATLELIEAFLVMDEPRYMTQVRKMRKEAVDTAARVLAHLLRMYYDYVVYDILGTVYMTIASTQQQKWMGQFFAPISVCDMMAAMVMHDLDDMIAKAKKTGRKITVMEPCIGSGAMVLGAKRVIMRRFGLAGLDQFRFFGQDLDPLCCQMARIQLTLTDYRYMGNMLIVRADDIRRQMAAHIDANKPNTKTKKKGARK